VVNPESLAGILFHTKHVKTTKMKLETRQDSKKSDHALAAANIRRELKAAFPGIKFSVRSDSYSGGDSVDICWELGPTSREVEAITGKYQEGTFNGMIDLYEYDSDRSWTAKYGSAKYVHCQRDCHEAQAVIQEALQRNLNGCNPYEYQTQAWRILANYSIPPGAIVTGIEPTPGISGGLVEDIFRPSFTVA
jgi:hypothetical protein